jgi:predicted ribosome quality control (RQC) complex YloA/Tae2 family protein
VTDNISKELENYFEKELSRLANKINNLKSRIESGSKESSYYSIGNLLLSKIYELKKGMDKINLHDYQTNSDITIKLSPKLSPKENIDKYFEKAKDEKINYNKSLELLNFTVEKYNHLKAELNNYEISDSLDEITKIHKRVLPKKENIIKMDTGLKFKYWHYVVEEKYNIYIGRDSKSNDYLSIKYAKQNDYWFHARGMPGSHVVLKVENVKEGVPKHIIKAAANLAAYYSKAKTAGTVPVSYTFAKFVYKKKGMLPGKVMLTKEKTLMVKPEIPKNSQLMDN